MSDAVLVAIISFAGTIIATLGASRLTIYRIEQLEKKVSEHNNLVTRMYAVEKKVDILEVTTGIKQGGTTHGKK